jgi:hypothetical protein
MQRFIAFTGPAAYCLRSSWPLARRRSLTRIVQTVQ